MAEHPLAEPGADSSILRNCGAEALAGLAPVWRAVAQIVSRSWPESPISGCVPPKGKAGKDSQRSDPQHGRV